MLINSIIFALGLQIIFSENPMATCNIPFVIGGCQRGNDIVIGYEYNPDEVMYHEIGHKLFLYDDDVKNLLANYPNPRYYPDYAYPTEDFKLNERVADYFEMYMRYSDFPDKFPEVNELFNSKLAKYKK
jgi:hypothetical protein